MAGLFVAMPAHGRSAGPAPAQYAFTFTGDVSVNNHQDITLESGCKQHITAAVTSAAWQTRWPNVVLTPLGPASTYLGTANFDASSKDAQVIDSCSGSTATNNPCTGHATSDGTPARMTITPDSGDPQRYSVDIAALGGVKDDPHCNTGVTPSALRAVFTLVVPSLPNYRYTEPLTSGQPGSKPFQPPSDCSSKPDDMVIDCKRTIGWNGTVTVVRTR
jgi:hypothetical protein